MRSDAVSADRVELSHRAGRALLTLQLRAALQEADEAESAAAAIDQLTACQQLRAKLEPLMADSRRTLDAQLATARQDADIAISAAHRAASVMAAQFSRRTTDPGAPSLAAIEPEPFVEPEPIVVTNPIVDVTSRFADVVVHAPSPPAAMVVFDAEAFAEVFAKTFAAALDERMLAFGPAMASWPMAGPAPAPAKPSFWTHARHPDVLLIALATVITMIVLAAWLA